MWTFLHIHYKWTTDVTHCWHTSYETVLWGPLSLMALACAAVCCCCGVTLISYCLCGSGAVTSSQLRSCTGCNRWPIIRCLHQMFCQVFKEGSLYREGKEKMKSHIWEINLLQNANYSTVHFLYSLLSWPLKACGLVSVERTKDSKGSWSLPRALPKCLYFYLYCHNLPNGPNILLILTWN